MVKSGLYVNGTVLRSSVGEYIKTRLWYWLQCFLWNSRAKNKFTNT